MSNEQGYWQRKYRRRRVVGAAAIPLGAAIPWLAACGDDDDNPAPAGTAGAATSAPGTTAAGSSPSSAASAAGSPASAARKGGDLKIASGEWARPLDPHAANSSTAMVPWQFISNMLVRANPATLAVEGDLAKSWEQPDPQTIVLKFNQGVKWQNLAPVNGRTFDAEDAKFTIDRVRTPDPRFLRGSYYKEVESLTVNDPATLTIKTKVPFAPQLALMSDTWTIVVPKEVAGAGVVLGAKETMIGTGPMVIDAIEDGQSYTVKRRPDAYFKPNVPLVDSIQVITVPNQDAMVAALQTGKVHMHQPGNLSSDAGFQTLKGSKNVVTTTGDSTGHRGLVASWLQDPFKDKRVRQAVSIAIDREKVTKTIYGVPAIGYPLNSALKSWFLPDDEIAKTPGYRKDKNQDKTEAKQLLSAAGFPNGLEVELWTTPSFAFEANSEVIVPELQSVGIKVKLKSMDFQALLAAQAKGDPPLSYSAVLTGTDPDSDLSVLNHSKGTRNYAKMSDPDLDKVIEAQGKEIDATKRKALVLDAQRRVIDLAGWIWVEGGFTRHAYRDSLGGYITLKTNGGSYAIVEQFWLKA